MVGISDANDEEKDQKVVEAASLPLSRMRVRRNPEKKVVEESSDSDSGKDCSASDEEDEGYKPKGRPNAKKPVTLKKAAPAASIKKKAKVTRDSDVDSDNSEMSQDNENKIKKKSAQKGNRSSRGKSNIDLKSAEYDSLRREWLSKPISKFTENYLIPSKVDRKSTRLNSSHQCLSRMPSSA